MAKHSSILAWKIPADGGAWQDTVHWGEKRRLSTQSGTHEETGEPCLSGFHFHRPLLKLSLQPSTFIAAPADAVCSVCRGDI